MWTIAIKTHYLGPTNTRGSRIVATSCHQRKILQYDDSIGQAANHVRAAKALAQHHNWIGLWHMGSLDDKYNVFVNNKTEADCSFYILEDDNA